MKTRKLANILIKILGLSAVVQSVPAVLNIMLSYGLHGNEFGYGFSGNEYMLSQLSAAIPAGIGVGLILMSESIAAFMFKEDEE